MPERPTPEQMLQAHVEAYIYALGAWLHPETLQDDRAEALHNSFARLGGNYVELVAAIFERNEAAGNGGTVTFDHCRYGAAQHVLQHIERIYGEMNRNGGRDLAALTTED